MKIEEVNLPKIWFKPKRIHHISLNIIYYEQYDSMPKEIDEAR